MKKYKWKIQLSLEINEDWVADGFDMSSEYRKDQIQNGDFLNFLLPFADNNEGKIKMKIIEKPNKKLIQKAQGF